MSNSNVLSKIIKKIISIFSQMPFKSIIMLFFIPIIIIFITITGTASFILAEQQITENANKNVNDIVNQTKSYIDYHINDVFQQFVYLESDSDLLKIEKDASENIAMSNSINTYLNFNKSVDRIYSTYNSIVDSIFININDGKYMIYKNNYLTSQINYSYSDWKKNYEEPNYYWLNTHKDYIFLNQDKGNNVVSLFKLIGNSNSKVTGIINFNFKESFFRNILEEPEISKNGYLVLISNDGVMQFKNVDQKYQMNKEVIDKLAALKSHKGNFTFHIPGREKMLVSYNTIEINNWKIAAIIPEDEMMMKANYIKYITVFLVIFLIIIGVFLSSFLSKIISKPITKLTNKVKKVRDGDLNQVFYSDTSNEIGVLNNVMNELILRVKQLLIEVKEEQESKRNAELAALQAQINPHFLYNTLYVIKQLCDMGESKDASNMISALSNFFRIGISKGREVIKIEEEIEHIKNYFFIQHMRYSDDFKYQLEISPEIYNCEILKLTIQPLVENAIYHGVKQKRGQGSILVKGSRIDDNIVIDVMDDGIGMTEERLKEVRESLYDKSEKKYALSFGIRNVNDRLRIHYGKDYGIELFSKKDIGTTVRIVIPYKESQ